MTEQKGRRKLKRRLLIVALVVGHVTGGFIYLDRKMRSALISGPMVQLPEPDTLAVVWELERSWGSGQGTILWTGPDGSSLEYRSGGEGRCSQAVMTGLTPGTTYTYSVIARGFLGRRFHLAGPFEVRTPPGRDGSFRFVAFGDSGVGSLSQEGLADLIAAAEPEVVIHTGDVVYPAGLWEDYLTNFFEPNAAMIRSAHFMPSLGNHDCATDQGRPLLERFVLPENGPPGVEPERNYWFDYGDARFVALDSNKVEEKQGGVLTPEQMKTVVAPWLRDVLTDCDARWKFVYFHHPFYTGSQHAPEGAAYVKDAFVNVFEECGVDIVFAGHNHLYERTAPILREEIVDEGAGVVYVTTGAGGAARYDEILPPPDYMRSYDDKALSFTQVDLTADRLELKQIGDQGQVLDEYVIEKDGPPGEDSDNRE